VGLKLNRKKRQVGFQSIEKLKQSLLLDPATEFVIYELEIGGELTIYSWGLCDFYPENITSEREVERLTTPPGGYYDPARQGPALPKDLPDTQSPRARTRTKA
jgi:hypothetical protein